MIFSSLCLRLLTTFFLLDSNLSNIVLINPLSSCKRSNSLGNIFFKVISANSLLPSKSIFPNGIILEYIIYSLTIFFRSRISSTYKEISANKLLSGAFSTSFKSSMSSFSDVFESTIGTIGTIKSKNLVLFFDRNKPSLIIYINLTTLVSPLVFIKAFSKKFSSRSFVKISIFLYLSKSSKTTTVVFELLRRYTISFISRSKAVSSLLSSLKFASAPFKFTLDNLTLFAL
ncbi:unknown [Dialister sp. CAG:588]|nr:unknown [Dialister sp. CAG:588]